MNRVLQQLIDALLDPTILAELTGRPVVADRLRIKPGTSVVIGLRDQASGRVDGWARILWPAVQDKASKAVERAERRGQRIHVRAIHAGLLLQAGEVSADPQLAAVIRQALKESLVEVGDQVLRYNPLRRFVLRRGATTVRLSATPDEVALPLDWALTEAGVPVPGRLDTGSRPQVAVQAFVGDTDLEATPNSPATRAVGEALARLHTVELAPSLADALAAEPDLADVGAAHVALLGHLDDGLAERMGQVAAATASRWAEVRSQSFGGSALVHGDASPDQMLLDITTGRTWITDFDRACLAAPAVDLGSYLAATTEPLGRELLDGYASAGGAVPGERELTAARARALLLSAVDPVRRANPEWRDLIEIRLDEIEEALK